MEAYFYSSALKMNLLPTTAFLLSVPYKGQKYPLSCSPTPDAREDLQCLLGCHIRGLRQQNAQRLQELPCLGAQQ